MAAFSPLLDMLADVPDPRRAEGKLYEIAACMAVAAFAGALLLEIDRRMLLGLVAEKRLAARELEGFESEAKQLALLASTPAYA